MCAITAVSIKCSLTVCVYECRDQLVFRRIENRAKSEKKNEKQYKRNTNASSTLHTKRTNNSVHHSVKVEYNRFKIDEVYGYSKRKDEKNN